MLILEKSNLYNIFEIVELYPFALSRTFPLLKNKKANYF